MIRQTAEGVNCQFYSLTRVKLRMNVHLVWFFCLFAGLWVESAALTVFQRNEGGNVSLFCPFSSSEHTKFFCRNECKEEDILIRTDENRTQSGRYGIECKYKSSEQGILILNITHLTKSDSGRYRCGLGTALGPDPYKDFEIRVLHALQHGNTEEINIYKADDGGNVSVDCYFGSSQSTKFFCKEECKEEKLLIETTGDRTLSGRYSVKYERELHFFVLRIIVKKLTKSDSGKYKCGSGSSLNLASVHTFRISVTEAVPPASTPTPAAAHRLSTASGSFSPSSPDATTHFTVIILVVCLLVVVVLSVVILLFLHKWKTNRNSENKNMECVSYDSRLPASTCEDSIYQSLDPASSDQDQTYSTVHT
uniref:polymeric immunoglobulin receptor-like isoform X2 n=1 Tax=Monopterus albus TaxID=43700 RepID=UPI0009B302C6|nr:polymeric immunoglobulin receptor-like isoform X2 [Monopterus albus]